MDSLSYLLPLIGNRKTLVITCHECGLRLQDDAYEQVYTYFSLGSMLCRHDHFQQESIRYFLETKGCTQIIVAGHLHCSVLDRILRDMSSDALLATLKFNLENLLKNNHASILPENIRETMLTELNTIQQGKILMEYHFIREAVSLEALNVMGIVIDGHPDNVRVIFQNGVTFNDHISMN